MALVHFIVLITQDCYSSSIDEIDMGYPFIYVPDYGGIMALGNVLTQFVISGLEVNTYIIYWHRYWQAVSCRLYDG
jgi:hypothetical protein